MAKRNIERIKKELNNKTLEELSNTLGYNITSILDIYSLLDLLNTKYNIQDSLGNSFIVTRRKNRTIEIKNEFNDTIGEYIVNDNGTLQKWDSKFCRKNENQELLTWEEIVQSIKAGLLYDLSQHNIHGLKVEDTIFIEIKYETEVHKIEITEKEDEYIVSSGLTGELHIKTRQGLIKFLTNLKKLMVGENYE